MVNKTLVLFVTALLTGTAFGNPSFKPGPIPQSRSSFAPPAPDAKKSQGKPQPKFVPNGYIVQLKSKGPISKRAADLHEEFHLTAKRDAGLDYSVRETFSAESLFVGLSLTLHNADVQALKGMSNVAGVWPIQTVPRPLAAIQRDSVGPRFSTAPVAGTNYTLPYLTGDLDVNRPHSMTAVDKAHAVGIKGKGVKIAIIDTGVDYEHPSLGGCFGPGCKIAFGYDFAGDDYNPNIGSPATESPDPIVHCLSGGHGTHVSGIVGMQDQPGRGYGLVGVAPEATLGMYRIFGCSGGADDDIIMKALIKAGSEGVNVISMSFGQMWQDEDTNPYTIITSSLVKQGVALFAANGNSGSFGIGGASIPAISRDVFGVGSVSNEKFALTYQLKDSNGRHLRYSAQVPQESPPEGLIVQVMSYGGPDWLQTGAYIDLYEEVAANLSAAGIDPATVILATRYGDYAPEVKARVASRFGYKYFATYSTAGEDPWWGNEYAVEDPEQIWPINPITITSQDGATILSSYGRNPLKYKISLSSTDYAAKSSTQVTGGSMSNFSSFGPTTQLNIKPQLSAPGGNILATWPLGSTGYTIISGTSMSTPYMAAAYALVKSQRPSLSVHEIYALMQESGKPIPWYYNKNIKSAAIHQGSGLLNVHNALTWESIVTPTQLNAGLSKDYVNWKNTVTLNFTITNKSSRSKTYTFSHTPAGLMQNLWWDEATYNNMYPYYGSVKFHTSSVLIQAGASSTVSVDISAPVPDASWGDDAINLVDPMYSGFIVVINNYETYTIPYVGQIWDNCRFLECV